MSSPNAYETNTIETKKKICILAQVCSSVRKPHQSEIFWPKSATVPLSPIAERLRDACYDRDTWHLFFWGINRAIMVEDLHTSPKIDV